MPEGETTEEHRSWQREEASAVEKDRKTAGQHRGGLFHGCFGRTLRTIAPPIRDNQDGVDRCPRCTWELEDGYCTSCDYQVPEWGGGSPISFFDEEEIGHHYFGSNFPDSSSASSDHTNDLGSDGLLATERAALRQRLGPRGRTIRAQFNPMDYMATPARYSETEDGLEAESDFSEDDEDAGSLDDFVVHDMAEETRPRVSPQSSHYDSDEITDIVNDFGRYSSDEDDHDHSEENGNHQNDNLDRERAIVQLDSDSDQSPVVRNRRFGVPRSSRTLRLSFTDEDEHLAANLHNPSHRDIMQQIRRSGNMASNTRNSDRSRDFPGFPIEIDSDSESDSMPPTRRRRAITHHIVSDDDDDENDENNGASIASDDQEVESSRPNSNGTTTAGRRSSAESSRTDRDPYSIRRNPRTGSNAGVLDGSDALCSAQSRHNEPTLSPEDVSRGPRGRTSRTQLGSPSPTLNPVHQIRRRYNENNSSPGSGSRATRARLARTSVELSGLESRVARLEQIRPPHRPSRLSPAQGSHLSLSSHQAHTDDLSTQLLRFREARKRERRATKQDRRVRERASNMSRSLRPPSPMEGPMTWDRGLDY